MSWGHRGIEGGWGDVCIGAKELWQVGVGRGGGSVSVWEMNGARAAGVKWGWGHGCHGRWRVIGAQVMEGYGH